MISQDFIVGRSESSPRLQRPHGNPCPGDACRSAAHTRIELDARQLVGDFRRHPYEQSRAFLPGQRCHKGLCLIKCRGHSNNPAATGKSCQHGQARRAGLGCTTAGRTSKRGVASTIGAAHFSLSLTGRGRGEGRAEPETLGMPHLNPHWISLCRSGVGMLASICQSGSARPSPQPSP